MKTQSQSHNNFWLGSIGDTTEFQFAFRSKLRGIRFLRRPTNNFDFFC